MDVYYSSNLCSRDNAISTMISVRCWIGVLSNGQENACLDVFVERCSVRLFELDTYDLT